MISRSMLQQANEASWWDRLTGHPLFGELTGITLLLLAAWAADTVARRVILRLVTRLVKRTALQWDDLFLKHGVFTKLAHLAPLVVINYAITLVPDLSQQLVDTVQRVTSAALVLVAVWSATAALSAVSDILSGTRMWRGKPINAILQVVKILLWFLGAILVLASILGQNPLLLLSGLGAATAVLLLVFRDTIISFVSSLQIASYDMVRVGDWIEMPEVGADGDVIRIDLLTVSVQNWDKTVTTIPTYKLTQGSFKNWRWMSAAGGRRISRSLFVDMQTVKFLSEDDIALFEKYDLLTEYIRRKKDELASYNTEHVITPAVTSNVRRLTNVGTFRAYITAYLRRHPKIHQENFTLMVRQLAPTPQGLPLQIYCFTNDTVWANYESIQSDIFDHLLAIAPEFGLGVFQEPTGSDIRTAVATLASELHR